MRTIADAVGSFQKLHRRVLRACLGPLTIADLEIGWSPTLVGKLQGRIDIPGAVTGFLYIDLKLFNKQIWLVSWQLA